MDEYRYRRNPAVVEEAIEYATSVMGAMAHTHPSPEPLVRGLVLVATACDAQSAHLYAPAGGEGAADGGRGERFVLLASATPETGALPPPERLALSGEDWAVAAAGALSGRWPSDVGLLGSEGDPDRGWTVLPVAGEGATGLLVVEGGEIVASTALDRFCAALSVLAGSALRGGTRSANDEPTPDSGDRTGTRAGGATGASGGGASGGGASGGGASGGGGDDGGVDDSGSRDGGAQGERPREPIAAAIRRSAAFARLGGTLDARDPTLDALLAELCQLLDVERARVWLATEDRQTLRGSSHPSPGGGGGDLGAAPVDPGPIDPPLGQLQPLDATLLEPLLVDGEEHDGPREPELVESGMIGAEEGWRALFPLRVAGGPAVGALELLGRAGTGLGERARGVARMSARAVVARLEVAGGAQRESALRRSESARSQALQRLLDTVGDLVVTLSLVGVVRAANQAAVDAAAGPHGTAAVLLGHSLAESLHPDDRDAFVRALGRLAGGGDQQQVTVRFRDHRGVLLPMAWTLERSEHEAAVLAVGHIRHAGATVAAGENDDVTGRLVALRHALEGPVTDTLRAVTSPLVLLRHRHGAALGADGLALIEGIDDGGRAARAIVQRIVEYLDAGTTPLVRVPVDLDTLVDRAASSRQRELRTADLALDVGPLPRVVGDPVLLVRLIEELLINAARFSSRDRDQSARLDIAAVHTGAAWEITFHDHGIGLAPEEAALVGGLGVRLRPADPASGVGVGFATARWIAERHGGTLTLTAVPQDGTRVTLMLPD